MNPFLWLLLALLALAAGFIGWSILRRYQSVRLEDDVQEDGQPRGRQWLRAIQLEASDGVLRRPLDLTFRNKKFVRGFQIAIELSLILLWSVFVGREYLDLDPHVVPAGREFGSSIQAHHLWTRVQECGWCALWDGSERGGFPAFVDPLGSSLHPAVMIATLTSSALPLTRGHYCVAACGCYRPVPNLSPGLLSRLRM